MNLYSSIVPIEAPIAADRQGAKRHYGVHPYFTRRPYNVVRDYILHYSRERDRVLDPFGGSGVTAIEAFLENRIGIHNDINPLANFIAKGVAGLAEGNLHDYEKALLFLEEKCKKLILEISHSEEKRLWEIGQQIKLPENVALPKNSDVEHYYDLFSTRQFISLAVLRGAIETISNAPARNGMLLAWSAALGKLNKTFLSAEGRAESRGGSSIFSIYRYKIAKEPVELNPWETFYDRATNILKAKMEIDQAIQLKRQTNGWYGQLEVHSKDIEELSAEFAQSVDYIFTDPPYGGHISYLDLSTLWNSWLGLSPDFRKRENELIVGGELNLSESHYQAKLGRSIQACVKMLKQGRWLSIVFQHWNASYFETILSSATESGAELKAAVSQVGDPIWSMHKKKNSSVLAGELILTFYKTGKPKKVIKDQRFDVSQALKEILENTQEHRIFGEHLFNRLIIEAWKRSAIASLNISRREFMNLLEQFGWQYDDSNHYWVKHERKSDLLFNMSR
jgi:adenine-specific DNA methylase